MGLIDADALIEDCQKYLKTLNPDKDTREYARIKWLIGVLNNVPTIEPERTEIIRCKDCNKASKCYGDVIMRSRGGGNIYCPLEFCSEAERRTDDSD